MKILLVGSFKHPMYAPAFESGFRSLGHEVITVNYDEYLYGNVLVSMKNSPQQIILKYVDPTAYYSTLHE